MADRRPAQQQAEPRASGGSVQEGPEHPEQFRRGQRQFWELVQHHEQRLLGSQLGEPVERVVPVGVGAGEQVPQLVWSRVMHLPGELRELAASRPAPVWNTARRSAAKCCNRAVLPTLRAPPDHCGWRVTPPPPLQRGELVASVDEHAPPYSRLLTLTATVTCTYRPVLGRSHEPVGSASNRATG